MFDSLILIFVLICSLALFVWGKYRYDLVAVATLLVLVILNIVPHKEAFIGFSHPAVVTVVAVLIMSRGLVNAGVVDVFSRSLRFAGNNTTLQVFFLTLIVAAASSFINNIGALAIMMPIAIKLAKKSKISASIFLIPMAFGSHLGGFITLISTPSNLVISGFREEKLGYGFNMFDFANVGIFIAIAGLFFISLIGWRLLPKRKSSSLDEDIETIKNYTAEIKINEKCKLIDQPLYKMESLADGDISVVSLIRDGRIRKIPSMFGYIRANDILVVQAEPTVLEELVVNHGIDLVGQKDLADKKGKALNENEAKEIEDLEIVVPHNSRIVGKSAYDLNLRINYGVNLLAISRQGQMIDQRLRFTKFRPGDVLLVQGHAYNLMHTVNRLECLPLKERDLKLGKPHRMSLVILIFTAAVLLNTSGVLPVEIAFLIGAGAMILLNLVPIRQAYESVEWPLIVLIGAFLPVGFAIESTGTANVIATSISNISYGLPVWLVLAMIMVITMLLSDLINNVATAAIMAPIGIGIAINLGYSVDPFLMAVAIGAVSAFLTPIGHQSNTLVLGPGGYRFSDYWRVGLPLDILIVIISIPMILAVWPL